MHSQADQAQCPIRHDDVDRVEETKWDENVQVLEELFAQGELVLISVMVSSLFIIVLTSSYTGQQSAMLVMVEDVYSSLRQDACDNKSGNCVRESEKPGALELSLNLLARHSDEDVEKKVD